MFWGMILIIAGLLMLADHLNIIHGHFWQYLWPMVLIALGASMIFRRFNEKPKQ